MTQQGTNQKAAAILASLGCLSGAAIADEGSLAQDRADLVSNMPGIGGAAAGIWSAPTDFEGEMRGVLFNDRMEAEFEVEAMMTQLVAVGSQLVPDPPAELMEGFLYGDVYRVAVGQSPRELVGRLEGSWQGNLQGAGSFFALMYHVRLNQEVAGLLEGEFRGAQPVDGTTLESTSDDRSFGAPPPVQVTSYSAQLISGGMAGVGLSQPDLPPVDDCADVTACIDEHDKDGARRAAAQKAAYASEVPQPAQASRDSKGQDAVDAVEVPDDGGGSQGGGGWTATQIGGMSGAAPLQGASGTSAAGLSLVPEETAPGRFHGRWKLFL